MKYFTDIILPTYGGFTHPSGVIKFIMIWLTTEERFIFYDVTLSE